MDKSRQQFEETIKQLSDPSEFESKLKRANNGLNYADQYVDLMWIAWQASRESAEPEIKHHQLRELVNTARDTAIKYQGCQCLRSALSTAIRHSLICNGVKIKDE
ncbi:TPA: hypothetical protein ACXNNH_000242 [Proteus mirabilis]|uniref:hypothetical protein n=1 Tax=Proteus mirabilis TaxID=584 RepID=UPI0018C7719C|nr:hypothetical protein [Proteus mirabilis]MBG2992049.1 hypothetical protein [Proteus mirabilis]MBG6034231.1 hypothetical protein [Proteus mirabilis]MBI6393945.1 hypothetical protein [Proteus mirabilis]MBS3883467.1 hypothetical protein [Proteus mirabilis]HBC5887470.1 hypothetical protein [Proteus mirabilis]